MNTKEHKKSTSAKTTTNANLVGLNFSIPELESVKITSNAEHPIFKAIWFRLTSHEFAQTSNKNREIVVKEANRLYDFMCLKEYHSIDTTPVTVFNEFGIYISATTDPYRVTRPIVLAVERYIQANSHKLSIEEFDFIVKATNEFDLQRTLPSKKPSLFMRFDDCPYSDADLLVSLRLVCANLICMEQEVKDKLLQHPACSLLRDIKNDNGVEKDKYKKPIYKAVSSTTHGFHKFIGPVMQAIALTDNDWAKECILTTFINNRNYDLVITTDNVTDIFKEFTSGMTRTEAKLPLSNKQIEEIKEKLKDSRPSLRKLAEKYKYSEYEVHGAINYPGVRGIKIPDYIQKSLITEYSKPKYTKIHVMNEYGISSWTYDEIFLRKRDIYPLSPKTTKLKNKHYTIKGRIPSKNIFTCNYTVSHYSPKNLISAVSVR